MRKGKNIKRKKVLLLAQQKTTTTTKKKQLLFAQKEKNKQTKKTAICAVMVFSLCVKFEGFTVFGVICNYTQYPEAVTQRCTIKKVLLHF